MTSTVREVVHKVTVCSHDRVNPNSDTSDFQVNIEQIPNAKKFCLRHALLPLSSYTFEAGDIDSTLRVENLGVNPNGSFSIGGESNIWVNGFVIPNGSSFDSTQTFPPGGASSQMEVGTTFFKVPAGQKIMMYSQLDREPLKLFSDIPGLINNTASDVFLSQLEVITALNTKLDAVCRGILGANYNLYVTVHASTYSYAPYNLELYNLDTSNIDTRKPFLYTVWGLPNDQIYPIGIFQDFDLYIAPIADTSANRVPICTFSNKYEDGKKQTVDCEQPQGFMQTHIFTRTLTAGVVYTRNTLLTMLNTVFTEVTFSYTGSTTNVLRIDNTSTQPDWSKGTLTAFKNDTLGFTDAATLGGYNIDFTEKLTVAPSAIDLGVGIDYFSVKVSSDVPGTQVDVFERSVNLAIAQYGIEFKAKLRFSDIAPRLNIDPLTVSMEDTLAISPNYVYGFRLKANTATFAGAYLSNSALNVNVFTPPRTFYDLYAGFAYNAGASAWAVSQTGYLQSLPTSTIATFPFPVDEPLQIADIQTVLNTLTLGLTATISTDKNIISFSNSSARTFRIYPNHKLGIFNTASKDQSVYIVGNASNVAMTNPIDLTARNMCMSIGLSIYHDGRTATGLGSVLDQGIPRPIRRNIVATVYNGTSVNYGQMIQYSNPSDTWLPSYYNNISTIGVQIFNDYLQPINLHQKNIHLEIDIIADAM
jgi:hypothetical protein